MARCTKEKALVTRRRILDAAEVLFARHGAAQTSLHAIAQAAGVTRGAVYWHFKDKSEVLAAVMQRAAMPFEEAIALSPGLDGDPLPFVMSRVVAAMNSMVKRARTRRVLTISLHDDRGVGSKTLERQLSCRDEWLVEVEAALKAAERLNVISTSTTTRSLALGLYALVDGLIRNWLLDTSAFDLVSVGCDAARACLHGLSTGSKLRKNRCLSASIAPPAAALELKSDGCAH